MEDYEKNQELGLKQEQLSKEFVREWLMEHGFQGLDGQLMPEMPESFVDEISNRYVELYERLTGLKFEKKQASDPLARIEKNVVNYFDALRSES